jgi:aspartate-semialdehyde dehydrogenase
MSSKFNIAIAGATGNVGREIIQILEDKEFPVDQLYLLASSRSKGQAIEFRGEELIVE